MIIYMEACYGPMAAYQSQQHGSTIGAFPMYLLGRVRRFIAELVRHSDKVTSLCFCCFLERIIVAENLYMI